MRVVHADACMSSHGQICLMYVGVYYLPSMRIICMYASNIHMYATLYMRAEVTIIDTGTLQEADFRLATPLKG